MECAAYLVSVLCVVGKMKEYDCCHHPERECCKELKEQGEKWARAAVGYCVLAGLGF